eukprot:5919316-Pyramimonas_sp.AAC.1
MASSASSPGVLAACAQFTGAITGSRGGWAARSAVTSPEAAWPLGLAIGTIFDSSSDTARMY